MALSSNNLTDIGQGAGKTTNFWIRYENSLPDQTNVVNNANSLLSVVENEFTVTTGWFGTPSNQFGTSHRQEVRLDQADTDNGGGSFSFPGASNSGFGNPISLDSQNLMSDAPLPAQRVDMVFMAEWVEVLMGIRGNWNAGDSSGEGLSHWSAITRFQQGHDNYYGSFVANWLNGDGNPNQGTILPNPARARLGQHDLYRLDRQRRHLRSRRRRSRQLRLRACLHLLSQRPARLQHQPDHRELQFQPRQRLPHADLGQFGPVRDLPRPRPERLSARRDGVDIRPEQKQPLPDRPRLLRRRQEHLRQGRDAGHHQHARRLRPQRLHDLHRGIQQEFVPVARHHGGKPLAARSPA